MKETITFDDVLLVPQFSEIESRSEVDISSELGTIPKVHVERRTNCAPATNAQYLNAWIDEEKLVYRIPIISSPMDTVTGGPMALAMQQAGGLGIVHRYNSIEEQTKIVKSIAKETGEDINIAAAIGATGDYLERAQALCHAGANILCVDVAHGHHKHVKAACVKIKEEFRMIHLMAGNIATVEGFKDLESWGADSIRIGIGGGSICSTRVRTGHGVPTLQSVMECARVARSAKIIADGGLKTSGDIVKALAAGADFVILGSMLAGTDESPGEKHPNESGNGFYKKYRGMASREAQEDWRGFCSVSEGISTTIPYKGSVIDVLRELESGIRSGLSYSGARSLMQLHVLAKFIKQTSCGQLESSTHINWKKD